MAVVQISRIQVRRGKANSGTGIPQLASGEMAWALDTQELYIGNGSVAEGAPAVGNTKILTQLDLTAGGNVLDLIEHIYKVGSGIQTGPSENSPVTRALQARLDDRVTVTDFGAVGDGVTDDTEALQRAIDQLFLNSVITKSSEDTPDGISTRVLLMLPPGLFITSGTIYVPSHASLIGAGADKTIIKFTGTGPAIQFVNDNSEPGAPDLLNNTLGITQPRNIEFRGLTVWSNTNNQTGMQLDAVKDSLFEDVIVKGAWGSTYNVDSKGIVMNAVSSLVTTERNTFNNVTIQGFSRAVFAKQDILGNTFNNCIIGGELGPGDPDTSNDGCYQGFVLGQGAAGNVVGEEYGPRNTLINNCRFENIKRHAVYVALGSGNTVSDSKLINVGNDGGGNSSATYPQVYFNTHGNAVSNLQSDRANDLATPSSEFTTVPYVPEVAGHCAYSFYGTKDTTLVQVTNYAPVFRLPVSTDISGVPHRDIAYSIDYVYRSTSNNFSRRGTIKILADIDNTVLQLSDEYDAVGISELDALKLEFKAEFVLADGTTFTGALGEIPYSIFVQYQNTLSSDAGYFMYTYSSEF